MQTFGLQLVTGPVNEPVTLAQAKQHLRVDFTDDDTLIGVLIQAAREYVEHVTNRVFISQTWQLTLDQFPYQSQFDTLSPASRDSYLSFGGYLEAMQIRLPVPKVESVTSITYLDNTGTAQSLDPSAYHLDANSEPARIMPVNGSTWPYPAVYVTGTVNITFVAGQYTASNCPASIQQSMLLLIGAWYGQREAISEKPMTTVPMAVDCLLASYRFYGVIV